MTNATTASSTVNTAAQATERVSEVARLSAQFAAAVAENMAHEMHWIAGWYSKLARAQLNDEIFEAFGRPVSELTPAERAAFAATLLPRIVRASASADNKSTGLGANAANEAKLSEMARMFDTLGRSRLAHEEKAAWDIVGNNS